MKSALQKALAAALLIASFLTLSVVMTACDNTPPEDSEVCYYGCPNARRLAWYKAHAAEKHKAKKLTLE